MAEQSVSPKPATEALQGGKDPTLALLLSFLIPGLGHLYLEKPLRALACFLAAGLFFSLGLWLSGPTIFSWSGAASLHQSDSRFYLIILFPIPELLNLGGTLVGAFLYLDRATITLPFEYPYASLGCTLTAISGLLNIFVMVDAWTLASDRDGSRKKEPALAAMLSWLIPGAGHFYLGQRFKAGFFFVVINVLFFLGLALGEGLVVNREKFFYYWAGQLLNGGAGILTTLFTRGWKMQENANFFDLGLLFATVAGLLNVLVMMSAYFTAREKKL